MTSRLGVPVGFISIGVVAILASFWASSMLRTSDFWSTEDQAELTRLDARYVKLRLAYVTENARRNAAGKPLLSIIPPAIKKASDALAVSKSKLRVARERPQQVATSCRWFGAGMLLSGLLALRARGSLNQSPSASDGGASQ